MCTAKNNSEDLRKNSGNEGDGGDPPNWTERATSGKDVVSPNIETRKAPGNPLEESVKSYPQRDLTLEGSQSHPLRDLLRLWSMINGARSSYPQDQRAGQRSCQRPGFLGELTRPSKAELSQSAYKEARPQAQRICQDWVHYYVETRYPASHRITVTSIEPSGYLHSRSLGGMNTSKAK